MLEESCKPRTRERVGKMSKNCNGTVISDFYDRPTNDVNNKPTKCENYYFLSAVCETVSP